MLRILLLEDDKSLNRGISLKLQKEGYEVLSAFGVTEAEEVFRTNQIDLIISDITMNDGNGLDFAKEVRKKSDVHILFLTALDQEVDVVNGYDVGADDYITKPFSLMVLISKVNAIMRRIESRQNGSEETGELYAEDICMQSVQMKVYKGGEELNLSKKEIQLLHYFLEHPGQIISKEQILEAVWGLDGQFVDDNIVPVTISRLKKRLSSKEEGEYIKNVRGLGYLWMTKVSKK
ncbi:MULTISPECIES: response regulator transcription factor [Dorea]|uniref:response regulator transcription factor n=1 Tax=Dorea TaxID=189330 RepID=UPI000C77C52C|nr:response regulator transcription factor [Dorea phocaeensis]